MRSAVVIGLLLAVITLAVYWQVGNHEFLNYDDNVYVTENSHVVSGLTAANAGWAFTSFHGANWHPVTWLSHMADVQLFGMNPRGHHLTNVFIHAAASVLLLLFLFRVTGGLWQSAFAAALFALHPLHVESVAWVAERKDVLSGFFGILTLLLYASYAVKRTAMRYALALASFALGLMSKPMLVSLPVILLLLDFWPLQRLRFGDSEHGSGDGAPFPVLLKEKVPFFVCALVSAILTMIAQQKGGAIRSFEAVPLADRIGNALVSYVSYLVKTVWPHDLAVFYPFPASLPIWQVTAASLTLLFFSAVVVRAARQRPYLLLGWFWFLITLAPVIGIIQVGGQAMADRYSYLPLVGLFIMAAWEAPRIVAKIPCRRALLAVTAVALLAASAVQTWRQTGFWQDNFTLYRHAVRVTAGNDLAHYNLGFALDEKGDLDGAIGEYREAIAINPRNVGARNNLGFALDRKGDLDGAIREYREALAVSPRSFAAHYNLGLVFDELKESDRAMEEFRAAVSINPGFSAAHYSLGADLAKRGDVDSAIGEYREAIRGNPDHLAAHCSLGICLAGKGDLDGVVREFREALRINPASAAVHNNLGGALEQKGDPGGAIREFREALRLSPEYFDAHNNLGVALQRSGDLQGAVAEYREALRINPASPSVRNNLAVALAQGGAGTGH